MDCYKVMNLNDFDALGVPQLYDSANFDKLGNKEYCIFKGENYGIIQGGEILVPFTNGINPFESKNNSAYIDNDRNLWVGVNDS